MVNRKGLLIEDTIEIIIMLVLIAISLIIVISVNKVYNDKHVGYIEERINRIDKGITLIATLQERRNIHGYTMPMIDALIIGDQATYNELKREQIIREKKDMYIYEFTETMPECENMLVCFSNKNVCLAIKTPVNNEIQQVCLMSKENE